MGNIIRRRNRDRDNDYTNPEMPELNINEIEIVQRTWKIPNSKVNSKNLKLILTKKTFSTINYQLSSHFSFTAT